MHYQAMPKMRDSSSHRANSSTGSNFRKTSLIPMTNKSSIQLKLWWKAKVKDLPLTTLTRPWRNRRNKLLSNKKGMPKKLTYIFKIYKHKVPRERGGRNQSQNCTRNTLKPVGILQIALFIAHSLDHQTRHYRPIITTVHQNLLKVATITYMHLHQEH